MLTLQTLLNQALVSVSRKYWNDVETRADIDSIESIVVDKVFPKFGPYDFMVFTTLNVSASYTPNYAYENLMYFMEMEINKLLPNSKVEFKINNSMDMTPPDTTYLNEQDNKNLIRKILREESNSKCSETFDDLKKFINQNDQLKINWQLINQDKLIARKLGDVAYQSDDISLVQREKLFCTRDIKVKRVPMKINNAYYNKSESKENKIKFDYYINTVKKSFFVTPKKSPSLTENKNNSVKSDKLIKGLQSIVDQSLIRMHKDTEEMGLGEMEFINEIDSIEGVIVEGFYVTNLPEYMGEPVNRLYLDMYVNGPRYGFDGYSFTRSEIKHDINKLIPNTGIYFTIKDTRTFGPGIDY